MKRLPFIVLVLAVTVCGCLKDQIDIIDEPVDTSAKANDDPEE